MTDNLDAFFIFRGNDLQGCIFCNEVRSINQLTVYTTGNCIFCKPGSNALGNVHNRNSLIKLFLIAVWQRDNWHKMNP